MTTFERFSKTSYIVAGLFPFKKISRTSYIIDVLFSVSFILFSFILHLFYPTSHDMYVLCKGSNFKWVDRRYLYPVFLRSIRTQKGLKTLETNSTPKNLCEPSTSRKSLYS